MGKYDDYCEIDGLKCLQINLFFFFFRTGFRPTKGGRLICLVRRGMRIGKTLFPLGIELGIPRIRPWKEFLATGAQATWFTN
jgi:hypothetical protein